MADTKRTVNLKGKEFTLAGPEITVGQKAPGFKLIATDSSEVELSHSRGKVRLLSVVHSLDTGVCDLQTQRSLPVVRKCLQVADIVGTTVACLGEG